MVTLQEQFEKDFPNKNVREIVAGWRYENNKFTNWDLDLSGYVNLESLNLNSSEMIFVKLGSCKDLKELYLAGNKLTSVDFLNQLPNPEKLESLSIFNNNIQPTDIEIFSKFVNLEMLRIGTMDHVLKEGKHNKFHGSLKSYRNLTKLERICIEATDVNEGLEYLPMSLVQNTKEKKKENYSAYQYIECSPHNTNAKCKAIQDQLRPFDYDLEAWQLAHPHLMYKARLGLFSSTR